jgi:sterol desaturase/sphingolipid hydroxylase (fatty acid hydroxylase superfamily)
MAPVRNRAALDALASNTHNQQFPGAPLHMHPLDTIKEFFAVGPLLGFVDAHLQSASANSWLSLDALRVILPVVFPLLVFCEFVFLFYVHRARLRQQYLAYKVPVLSYVLNNYLGALISIDLGLLAYNGLLPYAPWTVPFSIAGFVYALLVWELGNFIFHYSCHKVRLLWCLHSPHHSPVSMNLSVIWTGFFLHGFYANIVRFAVAALLGVPMNLLLLTILTIGIWGGYIHVSEEALPSRKRDGWLSAIFLCPSDHRVHHAKNANYIDKNFCNLFTLWDRLFGTYQPLIADERPEYGILREIDTNDFLDMYLGEFVLLGKDLMQAKTFGQRCALLFGPPGAQHGVETAVFRAT